MAVASTGIAAILPKGGLTAHSRFGIPMKVSADTSSSLSRRSHVAKMLKLCDVIIWDEAPAISKHVVAVVDRFLIVLMDNNDFPFGGKRVIFSGDFRQTLPIIPKGGLAQITSVIIKKSAGGQL